MKWQPIETAPKDGKDILVLGAYGPAVAFWDAEQKAWITDYRGKGNFQIVDAELWMPIKKAPKKLEDFQWKPISTLTPEWGPTYLGYDPNEGVVVMTWHTPATDHPECGTWYWALDDNLESIPVFPTHWMELPEPPEGE